MVKIISFSPEGDAKELGITLNGGAATYQSASIDMFRYSNYIAPSTGNSDSEQTSEPILISGFKTDGIFLTRYRHWEAVPTKWIFPVRRKAFLGKMMSVPSDVDAVLKHRYPLTYRFGIRFPYRWKCWI